MGGCENKDLCSFFQNEMGNKPSLVRTMKHRYCEKDKESCARYMIKSMLFKGYTLPDDHALDQVGRYLVNLYPNDVARAKEIIGMMVH